MTGIVNEKRADFSFFVSDLENGHIVINRPVFGSAIRGEVRGRFSPEKFCGFAIFQRCENNFFQIVSQLAGITIDVRQFFGRKIHPENIVRRARNFRRAMRVRSADGKFVRSDFLFREPMQKLFAKPRGNDAIIECE